MGIKESKLVNLSYEEALKRVNDAEQKKIKEAFKRSSTSNGHITKNGFIKDVLGDAVPTNVAERLYEKFGGSSKGLSLKDLICGLVLLTKGKEEEKMKFLFGFYSNDPYQFINKPEMDEIILKTEGNVVEELAELFKDSDQVAYEGFKKWMKDNVSCLTMSTWLLRESPTMMMMNSFGDQQTPTFYQTLAGITHLDETDIMELEKHYWQLKGMSRNGKFDLEMFASVVSPPLSAVLCEGLFRSFDENQDNHIDLKELACGISACCRGPTVDKFKFCFKLFDTRRQGILNREDIEGMMKVMLDVRAMAKSSEEMSSDGLSGKTPEDLCSELLSSCEGGGRFVTQGEYLIWALEHPLTTTFLSVLIQVCHICLGLRPRDKEEEADIILPWLARVDREGLKVGQVWYLVSMTWWKTWSDYIQSSPDNCSVENQVQPIKLSASSTSQASYPVKLENGGINLLSFKKNSIQPPTQGNLYSSYQNNFDQDVPNFSSLPPSFKGPDSTGPSQFATLPRKNASSTTMTSPPPPPQPPMSSSLHGESSSSTPSGSPRTGRKVSLVLRPAGVDNSSLVVPQSKVGSLTNEGGILRRDYVLKRRKDFEIVQEAVWKVFSLWYGKAQVALPRTVIEAYSGAEPSLELHPIQVRLLRTQNANSIPKVSNPGMYAGINSGLTGLGMAGSSYLANSECPPQRYLAYTATFSCKQALKCVHEFISAKLKISREDLRLWKVKDETNSTLLEEEEKTMEQLRIFDNQQILIEVRNKDLTWPEEIMKMAKSKALVDKSQTERGATGLNNLGNTCFMNSALQCLSNTQILSAYFTSGKHLYELNRTNPLGARGQLAEKYGQLVKDLWSGQAKSIAPVKLKWTINKYAPCFNDFQQHDSQELLAFVLDRLHEDLNRVQDKPYVELKDSDGRPDEIVAQEAWENHFVRNQSILVDLFHGQLKSQVGCLQCGHTSVKFDPFTFLSLPLPLESSFHLETIVVGLDASCPIRYGLRLTQEDTFSTLRVHLSNLSHVPAERLLVVEVYGSSVKGFPQDESKVKLQPGCQLFAYQLPPAYPADVALQRFNMLSSPYPLTTPSSIGGGGATTTTTTFPPPAAKTPTMSMMASPSSSSSSSMKCNDLYGTARSSTTTTTTTTTTSNSNNCDDDDSNRGGVSSSSVSTTSFCGRGEVLPSEHPGCLQNGPSAQHQHQSSHQQQQQQQQQQPQQQQHYNHNPMTSPSPASSSSMSRIQRLPAQQVHYMLEPTATITMTTTATTKDPQKAMTNGYNHQSYSTSSSSSSSSSPEKGEASDGSKPTPVGGSDFSSPVFVIAMHRKMVPSDHYFLWYQRLRASLFGMPLVLSCHQSTTHQDLYQQVWVLVSRLVSPLPPSDSTALNHAQDCDDSLKYEFPFVIKVVQKDGLSCVWCPWYRFCKGCPIECNTEVFNYSSCYLAIDWEPTALHLRYHASQEKVFLEHESIEMNRKQSVEPIGLDACLRAFTKEEHLGEKELYYCSRCKKHGHAVKKLELWSMPPILVIHLKRFQLFNNRWVKSQKIVKFPMCNFDPSNYLVQRIHPPSPSPRCISSFSAGTHSQQQQSGSLSLALTSSSSLDASNKDEQKNGNQQKNVPNELCQNGSRKSNKMNPSGNKMDPDDNANTYIQSSVVYPTASSPSSSACTNGSKSSQRELDQNSTSSSSSSSSDAIGRTEGDKKFHAQDHSNMLYDLYAVSCHSGILGYGHYTTYAKNPNGKWYYYNDSSCKEVTEEQVDTNSAYMLFYERQGLSADAFLSSVSTNRECQSAESDEEIDKELKKMCSLQ